jgi:hypothetical protein
MISVCELYTGTIKAKANTEILAFDKLRPE